MTNRAMYAFGAWAVAVLATYLVVPSLNVLLWASIVVSTGVVMRVAIARNRPRHRLPWLLLWSSYLVLAAGTVIALVLIMVLKLPAFPSAADAVQLGLSTPLLIVAMWALSRSGAANRDRASLIDSLILTTGAGFLSWVFLIHPYLRDPDLTALEKAISIAYPLCDVLLLALTLRLAITAGRSWSVSMLVLSISGLLTADVMYGLGRLNGGWQVGTPADLGWFIFYLAGAAAAMHPSMVRLTEPRVVGRSAVNPRRLVLGIACLIAPTVLFVQAVTGGVRDGEVIAGVSALLILLALGRMSVVANGLRRTMTRERELRRACEALLSCADEGQVTDAVHIAVARLLPAGTDHSVVLVIDEPSADPAEVTEPAMLMRYVRQCPPSVFAALGRFDLALHCRLSVADRHIGELYVAAAEPALLALQEAVPVLAGQAASMLDSMALNREINRQESQAYFQTLVLSATEAILVAGDDNRIRYASPAAEPMLGTAQLTGTDILDLVEPAQRPTLTMTLDAVRRGAPSDELTACRVRRANGELIEVELAIRDLRAERTVAGLVLTLRDVTERSRLQRELVERAYLDQLTGLGNRLRFQDTVRGIAVDGHHPAGTAAALLLNIDDFRVVNDTMGQSVGDALLRAVGDRLTRTVAGRGEVARLGGDEFGVAVRSTVATAEVERLADDVVSAFREPFLIDGSTVRAAVSVGVATMAEAMEGDQLLSQAHVALGTAKTAGKGQWRRYEAGLHAEVIELMQLRADLADAIVDGQFVLHYQPIVELHSGRSRGVEALVRWQHPTRGLVPPLKFIPLAEDSGMIVPLGTWVLREAIAAGTRWQHQFPTDSPYVSVNVSVRQFRTAGFVDLVLDSLDHAGLPAEQLNLEITESLLLGDDNEIRDYITRLRQHGVRISIDDFGTGFSSLSYLHRVPVDTLKLDKSFVDTVSTSTDQRNLVRGIIQLAHTLHMEVVAEGIETAVDQEILIDSGCGFGQGYLFARPQSEVQTTEWLAAQRLQLAGAATPG